MSNNFFDTAAQEASDEEDEEFDDETGEPTTKRNKNDTNGHMEDSSEEEDDDDEEAERAVREGFIVDEEDDQGAQKKRRRKKRPRPEEEDEGLEEEDLELIGELKEPQPDKKGYKRLKRGHRDEDPALKDLWDDELEDDLDRLPGTGYGEFDDFIDEDEGGEGRDELDDREVSRRARRGPGGIGGLQHLDEVEQEDMRAAFGDGTEYDWALEMQEAMEDGAIDPDKELELKDVFEPSQLVERMLTEEDFVIRQTDVPERYQLARKAFTDEQLSDEELAARLVIESDWIANMVIGRKQREGFHAEHAEHCRALVLDILRLIAKDNYEVPFIIHNRKDYLIHVEKIPIPHSEDTPEALKYEVKADKLLNDDDVWQIYDLDLKYRALTQKRAAVERTYESLKKSIGLQDQVLEDMISQAQSAEEVQDLQDYVNFQYSAELKDLSLHASDQTNGTHKKSRGATGVYERLRAAQAYNVVRLGFGITADAFARKADDSDQRGYTEDSEKDPIDLADEYTDEDYPTGSQVFAASKAMFAEELATSPRLRKFMRGKYFTDSYFECQRTEAGLRKIDEDHPYYELKYLREQRLGTILSRPQLFLKMLQAEKEGLIELRICLNENTRLRNRMVKAIESDNYSAVADAWNKERRKVLDLALAKISKAVRRQVKETFKDECENAVARLCKEALFRKVDQAAYKPKGMVIGTEPRVLALTNGQGDDRNEPITWVWAEDSNRILENGRFEDMRLGNAEKGIPEGVDVAKFVELVNRRQPDVIAVSGRSVKARSLYDDLKQICERHRLVTPEYSDDNDNPRRDPLDVVMVNDEVARLYFMSDRSTQELPGLAPWTKYCVAIARYLQGPLLEYVSLGKDLLSISFHPHQALVPPEKLMRYLDVAIIDVVGVTGVNINNAVHDSRVANLLPYVCGLGPRKAQYMLQVINRNGGSVASRQELVGDPEENKHQAVTGNVFANCASFLIVEFDDHDPTSDYLDSTRIHPEDYELARKVAADGLEMDEEDIKAEQDEFGPSAIVRKMVREDKQDTVDTLLLELYADQLERTFHQKKRATLETIREELKDPFEELRREVVAMSSNEMFTMMTGETRETLAEDMIIPVRIKRTFVDHIEATLDCGIEGTILESEYPSGVGPGGQEARNVYSRDQTVQAKILNLDRRRLTAQLSMREDQLRRRPLKDYDHEPGEWDDRQEEQDRRELNKRKEETTGRAQRVIKHPLFRPFNSGEAEQFLGSQSRGDCVIRPSSIGTDHLAITWKVSDNVYQHIDVLEMDKENEFSVGRILKIGGKYTYSDLDELIFNHVKSMAKMVDLIMTDERYQGGSKAETENWLNTYMEANPKRAMYAFCINRDRPGYFYLCFKHGLKHQAWPVKVVPNAFRLTNSEYPTMMSLKNGFKTVFQNQQRK